MAKRTINATEAGCSPPQPRDDFGGQSQDNNTHNERGGSSRSFESGTDDKPKSRTRAEPLSYTIAGAMEATGLGRSTLYNLMGEGTLSKLKVGRRTLIRADSIRALIGAGA